MEIRQQSVDDLEIISRIDKKIRFSLIGSDFSTAHCRLQGASNGRPDGDDTPAFRLGCIDRLGRLLTDFKIFRVYAVFGNLRRSYRLKRSGTDVQRQKRPLHTESIQLRQHGIVKMEARRRRGHRTGP